MRRIKIKLPFQTSDSDYRHERLVEMAQILADKHFFTIIEEKHLIQMSYIIILVENSLEKV